MHHREYETCEAATISDKIYVVEQLRQSFANILASQRRGLKGSGPFSASVKLSLSHLIAFNRSDRHDDLLCSITLLTAHSMFRKSMANRSKTAFERSDFEIIEYFPSNFDEFAAGYATCFFMDESNQV